MNVGIIGAGSVGKGLATGLVKSGHPVVLYARDEESVRQAAAETGATAASSLEGVVTSADVVVLAVPFGAVEELARAIRPLVAGKVVIDVTNAAKPDWSGPLFSGDASAATTIAGWLPEARIVKAFNTVFAANLIAARAADGQILDALIAGDDADAKAVVSQLATDLGFRPIDAGLLAGAGLLEGLAWLNISLNARGGTWQSSWKLVGLAA
ncbi:MAG TPA: NAD(P)-binding domain-containing protein [Candidatus Limnocylindrales bacterium]